MQAIRRIAAAGVAVSAGAAGYWVAAGDDPPARARMLVTVPTRTARVLGTVSTIVTGTTRDISHKSLGDQEWV